MEPSFFRLLKVNQEGGLLQGFGNPIGPQAFRVRLPSQHTQGVHVYKKLVGLLIPYPIGQPAQHRPLPLCLGVAVGAGEHRPCCAGCQRAFREIVSGVCLYHQLKALPRFSAGGQGVVHQKMMGHIHPFGPVGAKGPAVDKQGRLAPGGQVHHNALSLRPGGQCDFSPHPAVFIAATPPCPKGHRGKLPLGGLLQGKLFHGAERLNRDIP